MRSIAALALCPLLYGLPATAANLEAGYSVRWAGIEIARFEVELRTSPADYRLAYRAETTGALAWVFDFASDGSATGRWTLWTRCSARRQPAASSTSGRGSCWRACATGSPAS